MDLSLEKSLAQIYSGMLWLKIMKKFLFALALLASCALPFYAFATSKTWTGAGSNTNWTTDQNWNPSGTPVPGDSLTFRGGIQNPINVNMDFISFNPSSITFTNFASCQLSGSGVLSVGALASCPLLTCSTSFAEWQSGTVLNLNGDLELRGGLSSTFQFANLTGSGNIKVDSGVICNLTGANTVWTASSVTITGILNANASNALPTGANIFLQDLAGVQLNLENSVSNTVQNLTGGKGGSITLNNNSTLTLQNASDTYSGLIVSNGGTLQIGGSSTYTLTGSSGSSPQNINVDVQSGTLKAGTSGSLPNGNYTLSNPATLNLNGFNTAIAALNGSGTINLSSNSSSGSLQTNGNSIYTGVIQNGGTKPGSVSVKGFFLNLTGNNTYSGGTTIGSALLQISNTSNLGSPNSSAYAIIFNGSGATLQPLVNFNLAPSSGLGIFLEGQYCIFDVSASSMTISCPMSGPQGPILNGSNTLTLAGPATYSGVTTIAGGTLSLADGGNLPAASTVNVASLGTLDISPLTSPVTSTIGPLTGAGNVFLGANTLEVASGSTPTTFSGALTDSGGGGGLIKSGSAALSLTGANNYLGPTQINGGTLVIGVGGVGSLTNSPITVNSGGTLQGTGTISGHVTVENGGTISGGNSIGTISIGTLTLNPGSNLTLEINSAGASTIYDVTGTATLAGNLAVTVDRGNYQVGTTYTFVSTGIGGRIGTFDTVTSNTFGTTTLTGQLIYGSNFVELVLINPIYAIIPLNGLTGNAEALAEYLNSLSASPEVQPVLLAVGALPTDKAQKALDSISPARNAISSWTAQNTLFGINHVAVNRMLEQRYMRWIENHPPIEAVLDLKNELHDFTDQLLVSQELPNKQKKQPHGKTQTAAKEESSYAVWAEGLGLFARQNAIHENPSYHSSTGCGLIGADFYNFENGQMGAALGYAQSSIQESGTGDGSIQYYLAGLYGTAYINNGYAELGLWGSFDQFHNKRNVVYPGFNATAKSNHNGWQLVPHIGGGYDFNFCWGAIEPFATFDAAALFQQGYSEHGAGVLDMHVKSSTSWLLRAEAGLNAYQVVKWAFSHLIFRETLSYVNLAPYGIGKLANVELVGFPPGFTVTSFTDVQNMIAPGFELFFKSNNGFFFSLTYEGEFTIGPGNYMSNEAIGKIGYFF
jgi:autotransporter-associated beta strand repeat/autotransporter-associated beta strand repeat